MRQVPETQHGHEAKSVVLEHIATSLPVNGIGLKFSLICRRPHCGIVAAVPLLESASVIRRAVHQPEVTLISVQDESFDAAALQQQTIL
jgi:hypothetical protein